MVSRCSWLRLLKKATRASVTSLNFSAKLPLYSAFSFSPTPLKSGASVVSSARMSRWLRAIVRCLVALSRLSPCFKLSSRNSIIPAFISSQSLVWFSSRLRFSLTSSARCSKRSEEHWPFPRPKLKPVAGKARSKAIIKATVIVRDFRVVEFLVISIVILLFEG